MEECKDFGETLTVQAHSVGCEDCEKIGGRWVHLRVCLECGHVGCCDDSPNRHATGHAHETSHPTIASYEPGEQWGYCYRHEVFIERLPDTVTIERPGS